MRLRIFHGIFVNIFQIWTECEKYKEIVYGIMSLPHNTVMDLNHVMGYIYIYDHAWTLSLDLSLVIFL